MAAAIITAARVKQHLMLPAEPIGTDQEAILESLCGSAESFLAQWLGRALTTTSYGPEPYDGNDRDSLVLRHDPIVTLSAVSVEGGALTCGSGAVWPAQEVVFIPDSAVIRRTDGGVFPFGRSNILVTYTAGLGTAAPGAVVQAGVQWVAQLFSTGRRSLTKADALDTSGMPPAVRLALQPFRRVF